MIASRQRQLVGEILRGRRLIPCDWVQGYGLSETFGPFCWLDEEGHAQRRYATEAYCVGRPDDTLEVKIDPIAGTPTGSARC